MRTDFKMPVKITNAGEPGGVATLDSAGKVPLDQLPSISPGYELPIASTTQLGGVKIDGDTIVIDQEGVISSSSSGSFSLFEETLF